MASAEAGWGSVGRNRGKIGVGAGRTARAQAVVIAPPSVAAMIFKKFRRVSRVDISRAIVAYGERDGKGAEERRERVR